MMSSVSKEFEQAKERLNNLAEDPGKYLHYTLTRDVKLWWCCSDSDSWLLIDSDSDSGSDGTLPSPDQTIKLKKKDRGVCYRKGFKLLSFIVAPMLARKLESGDILENFTSKIFLVRRNRVKL